MTNDIAKIGHNGAPDPIEEVTSQYGDLLSEVQNWCDGDPVTDEAGMKAADALLKDFKAYKSDLGKAAKERTAPLHAIWKEEVAAVKVYTDDADLIQRSLVELVAPFKKELAEKKEAERRAAWQKAEDARIAAEKAEASVKAADLDAQRELAAVKQAAIDAQKEASVAQKDTVKGMRTVHHYEIEDRRKIIHWVAVNDKPAMTAFIDDYVRRNHKTKDIDGANQWQTEEAF